MAKLSAPKPISHLTALPPPPNFTQFSNHVGEKSPRLRRPTTTTYIHSLLESSEWSSTRDAMDPLSAFGFAANVMQFVELGCKLASAVVDIYHSADGTTAENTDVLVTMGRLEEASAELGAATKQVAGHQGLHSLCTQCRNLAQDLLQICGSLKAKKRGSTRESIRIAVRAWRKQDEIASIRKRLGEYRQQILLEISILMKLVETR